MSFASVSTADVLLATLHDAGVQYLFANFGSDHPGIIEALARRLGLPSRLREVAVKQEDFPMIARKTMQEMLLRNSRKPVGGPQDIEAILQLAW